MMNPFPDPETSCDAPPWRINLRWPFLLAILSVVIVVEATGVLITARFGRGISPLLLEAIIQSTGLGTALVMFSLLPPVGELPGKLGIRLPRWGDLGIAAVGLCMIYAWQICSLQLWGKILNCLKLTYEQHQSLLAECDHAALPHFLALLALAGVFIPIVEEVIFRRLLFGLIRPIGELKAMFITALIFAAAHGFLFGFPALFGLGLVFQWQYLHTRNLLTPMLTHMTFNIIALTLVFLLGM